MKRTALVVLLALGALIAYARTSSDKDDKGIVLFRLGRVDSNLVSDPAARVNISLPDFSAIPIAILKDKRFVAPASTGRCMEKSAWRAFEDNFIWGLAYTYSAGVLQGPLELTMQVGDRNSILIGGRPKMPLGPNVKRALASNSKDLGRTKVARGAVKDQEKADFLQIARKILAVDVRVPEAELREIEADGLLAGELGDGRAALIGTAMSHGAGSNHSLFLVIDRVDANWKPMLADHLASDAKKGPPLAMRFVDQLDVDGDGMDEIVAESTWMRGFRIYGFREGRWRVLYEDRRDGNGCVIQIR